GPPLPKHTQVRDPEQSGRRVRPAEPDGAWDRRRGHSRSPPRDRKGTRARSPSPPRKEERYRRRHASGYTK
ncbi:hypothetical protein FKM82_003610, partial [Ascaphus truei]